MLINLQTLIFNQGNLNIYEKIIYFLKKQNKNNANGIMHFLK